MASGTITVKSPASTVATYIGWSSSSNGSEANSSKVTATVYLRKTNGYTTKGTFAGTLTINGSSSNISRYGTWSGSYIAIGSKTLTVSHNADGKKSINISTTYSNSGTNQAGTYTGSGTAVLDTIPRASSISSGASWTAGTDFAVNINRNSGTFTHSVEIKVGNSIVASESGIGTSAVFSGEGFNKKVFGALDGANSAGSTVTVSTYSGSTLIGTAKVTGTVTAPAASTLHYSSDVNIGEIQEIAVNAVMPEFTHKLKYEYGTAEGYLIGSQEETGEELSCKWTVPSEFYGLMPDKVSNICRLITTTYYKGIQVRQPVENTFTLHVKDSDPVFSSFEHMEANPQIVALTGSNDIFVKGYSKVRAVIPSGDKAVACNGASMKKYVMEIGSQSASGAYNDNQDVILEIDKVQSGVIKMSAVDSRGLSTVLTHEAELKDYQPLYISSLELERENGVDIKTKLIADVWLWDKSFGAEKNRILSCTYKYKKSSEDESQWKEGKTILEPSKFNYDEGKGMYTLSENIQGDNGNGFSLAGSYDVCLTVSDCLSESEIHASVNSGVPGIYLKRTVGDEDNLEYQVGINCVPKEGLGSGLHVEGDSITLNGEAISGAGVRTPVGAIVCWPGDVAPDNWMLLDGSAVNRTDYPELFNVIGTKYGEGDGVDTFNLPNLCGRVPVGKAADDRSVKDAEFGELGQIGGEKANVLTEAGMPAHTHSVTGTAASAGAHTHSMGGIASRVAGNWNGCVASASCSDTTWTSVRSAGAHSHSVTGTAGSKGGGAAHNNLQPYIVLNYIIKAK